MVGILDQFFYFSCLGITVQKIPVQKHKLCTISICKCYERISINVLSTLARCSLRHLHYRTCLVAVGIARWVRLSKI
jgi:hypothetical protein